MALRELTDAAGSRWVVWDTAPATLAGLAEEYRGGWLTFDNGTERRRLAPVPEAWAALPDDRLALLLHAAVPADRHALPDGSPAPGAADA